MLAPDLSVKELRKEIYSLRRELRSDIKGVRELSRTSNITIPQDAVSHMRELEKKMSKKGGGIAVSKMGEKDLRNLYRDLEYIRQLKSSTVEGAIESATKWQPIKEFLDSSSQSIRDKFWDVYRRLVSNREMEQKFKYQIFDVLVDEASYGTLKSLDDSAISRLTEMLEDYYIEFTKERGSDFIEGSEMDFRFGFSELFSNPNIFK